MIMDQPLRRKICLALGTSAIVLFLLLRGFNLYGDPRPWVAPAHPANVQSQNAPHINSSASTTTASPAAPQAAPVAPPRRPQAPAWISFLNTTKYPASLLFLLMTLGPMLLVLPFLENAGSRVSRRTEDIWPRPILLLRSAHSLDPFRRDHCFTVAHRFGLPVAVHEPSRNESTCAASVCLEPWIALFSLGDGRDGALPSMPVVCGTETAQKGHRVPQLFVRSRCRNTYFDLRQFAARTSNPPVS